LRHADEAVSRPVAEDPEAVPSTDLPVPAVALAVAAHPDDVEFQAGATLARWAAAGCAVHHLILTDGSKGTWDAAADSARLVARREQEQRAAAARLGGAPDGVRFLRWPDGELEAGLRQRAQVAAAIRQVRPEVVLGHDPWRRYRLHPDHRNAGWLVCDGIVAARDPLFFGELATDHHRPGRLLLWEADEPNHVEIADDAALSTKVAALLEHRSQFVTTHGITDESSVEQHARFADRMRARLAERGALVGAPLGESFRLLEDL
jgi:LmbE family N-acetylglucosaminyl deacetylase